MISEYKEARKSFESVKVAFIEIKKTFGLKDMSEDSSKTKILEMHIKNLEKKFDKSLQNFKTLWTRIDFENVLDPEEIKKELIKNSDNPERDDKFMTKGGKIFPLKDILPDDLENETITRIKQRKKDKEALEKNKKKKDSSYYTKVSSRFFSKVSLKLLNKNSFLKLEEQLTKANLNYTPVGYISIILMTTFLSFFIAGFLFLFFLFFNFTATLPIISRATESIDVRFLMTFWILIVVPVATFMFMYLYPSLEKESASTSINTELPFATISMSAISSSMMSPEKIFKILILTDEYPALKKEFTKMINEINLYGYDLVSALKNTSKNSPSKELSELLNGLATTITSGGDLSEFFSERAQTLLFNYKIAQERSSRTAENFMDIYISILIAAPMILMLLLIIMKISGLGITMSFLTLSLTISLVVAVVNILFLAFLQLKKDK